MKNVAVLLIFAYILEQISSRQSNLHTIFEIVKSEEHHDSYVVIRRTMYLEEKTCCLLYHQCADTVTCS